MKKSVWLWLLATILTLALAYFQRISGPTYPVDEKIQFAGEKIDYSLDTSHGGDGDHQVKIKVNNHDIEGELYWKRYKTNDDLTFVKMIGDSEKLSALLPYQPPAGKLFYKVILVSGDKSAVIPGDGGVILRFKSDVPAAVLIPHIIFIFAAMLLSTRTGLEYFNKGKNFKLLTILTFIFVIIGGFILGPIAQYYAFGEFWTGFLFGYDLTDNKILIGFIGWLLALIAIYKFKNPRRWIIFASILLFIIFLIPHSLLGSELDYSEGMDKPQQGELSSSILSGLIND